MTGLSSEVLLYFLSATNYQPSEEFEVFQWLRDNGIDHYFGNFIRSNYTNLRQVSNMELTSDVLHELEMLLPGHRKRFKNARKYTLLFYNYPFVRVYRVNACGFGNRRQNGRSIIHCIFLGIWFPKLSWPHSTSSLMSPSFWPINYKESELAGEECGSLDQRHSCGTNSSAS